MLTRLPSLRLPLLREEELEAFDAAEGVLVTLELDLRAPLLVTLPAFTSAWEEEVGAVLEVLLLVVEEVVALLDALEDLLPVVAVLLEAEEVEEDLLVLDWVEGLVVADPLVEELVLLEAEEEEEDLLVGVCVEGLAVAAEFLLEEEDDLAEVEEDLFEEEDDLVDEEDEEDLLEEEEDLLEEEEDEDLVEEELLWVVPEEEPLLAWAHPSPEEAIIAKASVEASTILKMFFILLCFSCQSINVVSAGKGPETLDIRIPIFLDVIDFHPCLKSLPYIIRTTYFVEHSQTVLGKCERVAIRIQFFYRLHHVKLCECDSCSFVVGIEIDRKSVV